MSDDYKPNETREQYVVRRYLENSYAKQIMSGWKPTQFVQHYNPKKNPYFHLRRRGLPIPKES